MPALILLRLLLPLSIGIGLGCTMYTLGLIH
jgi:hypothetical protein